MEAKYTITSGAELQRQADEILSRTLALSPNLVAAHRELAQLQLEKGQGEEAVERLLSAEELFAGCVAGGFVNVPFFESDRRFAEMTGLPGVAGALADARKRHRAAVALFENCIR